MWEGRTHHVSNYRGSRYSGKLRRKVRMHTSDVVMLRLTDNHPIGQYLTTPLYFQRPAFLTVSPKEKKISDLPTYNTA